MNPHRKKAGISCFLTAYSKVAQSHLERQIALSLFVILQFNFVVVKLREII